MKEPQVPEELLRHLEKAFPDRAPDEGEPVGTIRFKAGQVSVVRYLRRVHEKQQRNALTTPLKP